MKRTLCVFPLVAALLASGGIETILSAEGVEALTDTGTNAPIQRAILYRPKYGDEGYIKSFKQVGVMELN